MPKNARTNVPVVSFTQPIKYGSKNPDDTPMLVISAMPAAAARSVRMRLGSCQKVVMLQKQAAEPIERAMLDWYGDFSSKATESAAAHTSPAPAPCRPPPWPPPPPPPPTPLPPTPT